VHKNYQLDVMGSVFLGLPDETDGSSSAVPAARVDSVEDEEIQSLNRLVYFFKREKRP